MKKLLRRLKKPRKKSRMIRLNDISSEYASMWYEALCRQDYHLCSVYGKKQVKYLDMALTLMHKITHPYCTCQNKKDE